MVMSSVVNFLSSVCVIHMLPLPPVREGGGAAKYVCLQFLKKIKLTCEKRLGQTVMCVEGLLASTLLPTGQVWKPKIKFS